MRRIEDRIGQLCKALMAQQNGSGDDFTRLSAQLRAELRTYLLEMRVRTSEYSRENDRRLVS